MDQLGGEWIIAFMAELHWDFGKKHFYKCLCKSYKVLTINNRLNKGVFTIVAQDTGADG